MRVEQKVTTPCAMCALMSQLTGVSERDRRVFQLHLEREHGIKPYFIAR